MRDRSQSRSAVQAWLSRDTLRQFGAISVGSALVLVGEYWRWSDPQRRSHALAAELCGDNADWLPYVLWLLLIPLFWFVRRGRRPRLGASLDDQRPSIAAGGGPRRTDSGRFWARFGGGLIVAACALLVDSCVGRQFGPLPPAYHDEFSYLFQAETFEAGRIAFPSFEPMPELFDQVHVLNEGRFASRYFPGTGLWIAVAGRFAGPYSGDWIAGMLVAWAVFQIGCELSGIGVGLLSGLLTACSPGLALFSNLLLAHLPTLVGLMLFVWQYCVLLRTRRRTNALAAGMALTWAMLCRPMTAFGIALPFGGHFAWWLLAGGHRTEVGDSVRNMSPVGHPSFRQRAGLALCLGGPIVTGLIGLGFYNRAITGDPCLTPYQLYTDIYTPRHVYGFNNVIRGKQHLGPKVLENYDRWAENLTPSLAARNVERRVAASLRWTLGIVPLAMGAVALVVIRPLPTTSASGGCPARTGWRLIGWAILSLHVVHIPYWFEGIMGWHYVFESAPLWLLLFAAGTFRQIDAWRDRGRPAMTLWWSGIVAIALAVDWVAVPGLWSGRLPDGVNEVRFARQKYAQFFAASRRVAAGHRAIVFVEADPTDRHIDYVVNTPSLDAAILYARYRPDRTDLAAARRLFPDRDAYLYDAAADRWQRLP